MLVDVMLQYYNTQKTANALLSHINGIYNTSSSCIRTQGNTRRLNMQAAVSVCELLKMESRYVSLKKEQPENLR